MSEMLTGTNPRKHPVDVLTEALGNMTIRCIEAELQRDEERDRTNEWYCWYTEKENALKEAESRLELERKAREDLEKQLLAAEGLIRQYEEAVPTRPGPAPVTEESDPVVFAIIEGLKSECKRKNSMIEEYHRFVNTLYFVITSDVINLPELKTLITNEAESLRMVAKEEKRNDE